MRNQGPAVYEWVARVWNAGATTGDPSLLDEWPDDAASLLKEVVETHLVQLRHNAAAYASE